MNTIKYKSSTFLFFFIMIMLPFVQLGMSYYVSVFFLCFLVALAVSLKMSNISAQLVNIIFYSAAIFLIKVCSLLFSGAEIRDILIPLREWLCYLGIILISTKISKGSVSIKVIKRTTTILLLTILTMVIIQKMFIARGIYFGFPIDYFVVNQGTLLGSKNALYYGTKFRPTSFYGEPSYTSWITISLALIILIRNEFTIKLKLFIVGISLLIILMSESLSGILAFLLIVSFWYAKLRNAKTSFFLLSLLACMMVFTLLFYASAEFAGRISLILINQDTSSNIRFQEPFSVIREMFFQEKLLGVNNFGSMQIDNAGLGLIIQYGILSVPLILLLLKFIKKNGLLMLYILLALNFNGAFFRYDKVLVISLIIGLTNTNIYFRKLNHDF